MDYRIDIKLKEEVLDLIKNNDFLQSWQLLCDKDYKVTVMQSPFFVKTWYTVYVQKYDPVMCVAYDDNNRLMGLMALAVHIGTNTICHAGDIHTEYRGWVCDDAIDQDFPVRAIIAIKEHFKPRVWQWGWAPPRSKWGWVLSKELTQKGIYIYHQKGKSYVWDLNDNEKLNKLLKNSSNRNQMNHYKKMGGYFLEKIVDKDTTIHLLDTIKIQSDFRQFAAYNVTPFASDSNKILFFTERINFTKNNHFTVLWSNGKMIASHYGLCDKDTLYLGLTTFDPLEYKTSPGKMLLLELAGMLIKEGYRYIDLTPGIDTYKPVFSNREQELVELTIYFRYKDYLLNTIKRSLSKWIKHLLVLCRLDPDNFKNAVSKLPFLFSEIKDLNPGKIVRMLRRFIYENITYLYYTYPKEKLVEAVDTKISISVQRYQDLMLYIGSDKWLTKRELIKEAFERFAHDERLYTIVIDEKLAHYGWMTKGGKTHTFTTVHMTYDSPPGSIILYDFYTEPIFRRQGLYFNNLKRMIRDSIDMGATDILIGVSQDNMPSKKVIEKAGFIVFRKFHEINILKVFRKQEVISSE